MNNKELLQKLLSEVDEEKLKKGHKKEIEKFRRNIYSLLGKISLQPMKKRLKMIEVLKIVAYELIAKIPIITPLMVSIIQMITGDDLAIRINILEENLGKKIDELGDKLSSKMDRMLELQNKTIEILNKNTEILEEIRKKGAM